jgi:hypothetical protein
MEINLKNQACNLKRGNLFKKSGLQSTTWKFAKRNPLNVHNPVYNPNC